MSSITINRGKEGWNREANLEGFGKRREGLVNNYANAKKDCALGKSKTKEKTEVCRKRKGDFREKKGKKKADQLGIKPSD